MKVGVSIADIAAGMYAFTGILTALIQRGRTGRGDVLEISMLEALGEWTTQPMYFAKYGGAPPARSGAHHASIAPYGPFSATDGTVFLAIQNDREWAAFCERVLLQPGLADDERFRTNVDRVDHRTQLHTVIDDAIGGRTAAEVIGLLVAAQIANARLRSMQEFADHPQLAQRDRWREVGSPAGTLAALLPPVTSREWDAEMGAIPSIGEHTDAVRREVARDGRPSPAE